MWATYALTALSAFSVGYLTSAVRDRHACLICHAPLPRVHADARCGGTPGLPDGERR